jgi:hypothetical protein
MPWELSVSADDPDPSTRADSAWAGIRDRVIALLADRPRHGPSYAEQVYGCVLAPPLAPGDLADLEAWLGIPLPGDYRTFLVEVSAGGAGVYPAERGARLPPNYQHTVWNFADDGPLLSIEDGGYNEWEWVDQLRTVDPSWVVKPFPTLRADDETRVRMRGAPPSEDEFRDPDQFERAFEQWAQSVTLINNSERTAGTIELARHSIDLADYLVVAGPALGQIWRYIPDMGNADLFPITDQRGAPLTFTGWYLDWLTEAETHDQRPRSDG